MADLHNAEELKNASVKFVVEHSEDFVDQVCSYVLRTFVMRIGIKKKQFIYIYLFPDFDSPLHLSGQILFYQIPIIPLIVLVSYCQALSISQSQICLYL